ncbi:MAG: hypothetical protein A2W22_05260 [Candidatus Levybacteria bacterium RBG_16_35_11]|nr:MAG: hypothetical protein A2W22_05260 [Candidatus Levybacteria bacterium RBG_16_35_11]
MNILMLNWRDPKNPKSGGAEYVTSEHCKAWVKAGHKVTWFTSKYSGGKDIETVDGIKFIRRGNSNTVYLLAPLYYLFSKEKFDLVIDQIHGLPFFTPLYVRKPKIAFIHEVASEIWDYMFPFPINKIGKSIEPFYFKLYKDIKFWTDSDSTIDDLEKQGIARNYITSINCPISNKTLEIFPKKEEKFTLIFVSRVVKMKGIEEVIRAFFYILRIHKNSQLWIVGDGEKNYVEELKDTMKSFSISPKVRFLGKVSEKKKIELLRKAHILLHASVKEGWGLVVIEAASQATPSVVYNVSGLKDSVKNGKTGMVLRENSAKEMANAALELFLNKKRYKEFQNNCLKWADSLTWEKATKQSLDLINNVCKKYAKKI